MKTESIGVYLAAKFARQMELQTYARELEMLGMEVTSRWLGSPSALVPQQLRSSGSAERLAQMDFDDLRRSSVCIAFTEQPDEERRGRGGRHTEFGIALALGHHVILVGPREHVFHCIQGVEQHEDWPSALRSLARRYCDTARLPSSAGQPQAKALAFAAAM